MSSNDPNTYLVGGTQDSWFFDNASRWADALSEAGLDAVLEERDGKRGGNFWYEEFSRMLAWTLGR